MIPITIKNLVLDFDTSETELTNEMIEAEIHLINAILDQHLPNSSPKLRITNDTEIIAFEIDEEEQ